MTQNEIHPRVLYLIDVHGVVGDLQVSAGVDGAVHRHVRLDDGVRRSGNVHWGLVSVGGHRRLVTQTLSGGERTNRV